MSGSDYRKKLKEITHHAEEEGWSVTHTKGGHVRFLPPDKGADIVIAPATSSDHRGIANLRANLRRSGLDIDSSG